MAKACPTLTIRDFVEKVAFVQFDVPGRTRVEVKDGEGILIFTDHPALEDQDDLVGCYDNWEEALPVLLRTLPDW